MGEAKRRGTFEERQALAIARKQHVDSEAARLFKEWKATQDAKALPAETDAPKP
jgi:hypothetical protein